MARIEDPDRRPDDEQVEVAPHRSGISPLALALGGLIVLLLLLWFFSGNRNADQDKLTGNEMAQNQVAANPEKKCASKATYDLIKRELFRRAAQVRGSDQAAFDKLAPYAVVRMENPVMESENSDTGAINCSGSLSLDLPPGVAVVGGRRTLTSDVDYTIQPAADNSGDVVLLRNAVAIVTPLATLARTAQPEPAPATESEAPPAEEATPGEIEPAAPAEAPAPRPSSARPSFNCADAHTRGEFAVCNDAGLASLDRQMAAQFDRAMAAGDVEQRVTLVRTRTRFLGYRDSCGSNACIADAYRGRMREIHDIMTGEWRPR